MLTGSRITWFVVSFLFVLPSMALLFRDGDGVSAQGWASAAVIAGAVAFCAAALFGGGAEEAQ